MYKYILEAYLYLVIHVIPVFLITHVIQVFVILIKSNAFSQELVILILVIWLYGVCIYHSNSFHVKCRVYYQCYIRFKAYLIYALQIKY